MLCKTHVPLHWDLTCLKNCGGGADPTLKSSFKGSREDTSFVRGLKIDLAAPRAPLAFRGVYSKIGNFHPTPPGLLLNLLLGSGRGPEVDFGLSTYMDLRTRRSACGPWDPEIRNGP